MPHCLCSTACGGRYGSDAYVSDLCSVTVYVINLHALFYLYPGCRIEWRGQSLFFVCLFCVIFTGYLFIAIR